MNQQVFVGSPADAKKARLLQRAFLFSSFLWTRIMEGRASVESQNMVRGLRYIEYRKSWNRPTLTPENIFKAARM